MRDRAASLIEKAVDASHRAFNFDQYAPGDASPAEIEEAARSYPLGSGRRLVMVRDLAGYPSDEQELIAELALQLAGEGEHPVVFAVLAPGLDRRRIPYRRLKEVDERPAGKILEFEAPKPWETEKWVRARASERGIPLGRGAAAALVDLAGEGLLVLDGELTKLGLYAGEGETVTAEDVETVVGRRRGETPWDLPRKLLAGEGEEAQRITGRLLGAGESPHFLLQVLTRQVLETYQVRLLLDQGARKNRVIQEVGIKPFAADGAISTARGLPAAAFGPMLESLKSCDLGLKSKTGQAESLFQQVVGRLADQVGRWRTGSGGAR
ncbi:MAG: DNA polymerase III subunit delta [bacterium]